MRIAIHGLGRMGGQIARKLAEGGHEVIAHNRSKEPIVLATSHGTRGAYTKEDVLKAFEGEQLVLWTMLPADVLENELNEWLKLAPKGSLFIDGGNSDFRLTKQRARNVDATGSVLLDVGTSGGVWGYENGFSMMVGGDEASFKQIEPVLKTLSQPRGGYAHFGESGSGHFVKMVHNAIEYGMMESLAEGYQMLKDGPYRNLDLGKAGEVWQKSSVVTSWLNNLAAEALKENPEMTGIEGKVAESGEARWTLETARKIGLPMPSIQASFDVRLASQKGQVSFATRLLAAMRNKFGGHAINPDK